ncbi:MAG: hypothetical protein SVM80_06130 [Halobacteriota archaeon]|nr:hypothetical protein [Halobacteriota archaeon]
MLEEPLILMPSFEWTLLSMTVLLPDHFTASDSVVLFAQIPYFIEGLSSSPIETTGVIIELKRRSIIVQDSYIFNQF